jgi:hypothetical protein
MLRPSLIVDAAELAMIEIAALTDTERFLVEQIRWRIEEAARLEAAERVAEDAVVVEVRNREDAECKVEDLEQERDEARRERDEAVAERDAARAELADAKLMIETLEGLRDT